jgi:hypothetical protein
VRQRWINAIDHDTVMTVAAPSTLPPPPPNLGRSATMGGPIFHAGIIVVMPTLPPSPSLFDLSPSQLRQRAFEYRDMAGQARTLPAANAMLMLAERFEAIAKETDIAWGIGGP